MHTERARRRLEPLSDSLQATLRCLVRYAPSAEEAARPLQIPVTSLLAGAAGARLTAATRRRIQLALDRRKGGLRHLHLVRCEK